MGHVSARDIYRRLGDKIDGAVPTPWNASLHAILKELYTEEEADLVVRMPYGPSPFKRLVEVTGLAPARLQELLEAMTAKGLVMDLWVKEEYLYLPSPLVIGIFELTLMRTRGELKTKEWAKLFHEYFADGSFFAANLGPGVKFSIHRALPHEEAVSPDGPMEILDYEKASALIDAADRFAVGICACRHEQLHMGQKACDVPLETCTSFGMSADYLIRHGLAREISRPEMRDLFAASRERRLVLCADNVQKDIGYVCHCCKCCCYALRGITQFGYPNAVATSGFIAKVTEKPCTGCGSCVKACPVHAVTVSAKTPSIDEAACLGCGVCVLACPTKALGLRPRVQRVIPPETIFERVILQTLEHGTLQNQLFDEPRRLSHRFLRSFVGGFLRLDPVKRTLTSDLLRSSFLKTLKVGARLGGKPEI